ncbi:hypothetical protein JW710_03685 [Candidatus Dojkabacteria bacterium]|nr:hypothetical protein [Candidatus Dojkabacteria bacterium]
MSCGDVIKNGETHQEVLSIQIECLDIVAREARSGGILYEIAADYRISGNDHAMIEKLEMLGDEGLPQALVCYSWVNVFCTVTNWCQDLAVSIANEKLPELTENLELNNELISRICDVRELLGRLNEEEIERVKSMQRKR